MIGGDETVDGVDVEGACEISVLGVEMADDIVGINDNVGCVFRSQDKLRP